MSQKNKIKRVQIQSIEGKKINFGFPPKTTKAELALFKHHAKSLVQSKRTNVPMLDGDERWLQNQTKLNIEKLAKLGIVFLTPEQQKQEDENKYSLELLIDRFIKVKRNHRIKDKTLNKWIRVGKRLKRYFSHVRKRTDVRDITQDDAEAYYSWTIDTVGLAEGSTANRAASDARAFFNRAIKEGLIDTNPFANSKETSVKYVVDANPANWYIVPDNEKEKIWNVLNDRDDELRFLLMIRLGLRSPSELNEVKWNDIDWETGMISIRSPKLKRFKKFYIRNCPIKFPDLFPALKAAYEKRKGDKSNIVKPISGASLRERVISWLGKAGIDLWPDLIKNFRRTAVTDACEIWPSHVVAAYFGHSEQISWKFYRGVTPEQAAKAANMPRIFKAKGDAA